VAFHHPLGQHEGALHLAVGQRLRDQPGHLTLAGCKRILGARLGGGVGEECVRGPQQPALVAGGTMTAVLDGREPPAATPPRLARVRPVAGSLVRVATYLMMGFSAALSAPPPLASRALPGIELARGVCRDPDPGGAGPALARIGNLLNTAEQLITAHDAHLRRALRLIHAAATIAATEPLPA